MMTDQRGREARKTAKIDPATDDPELVKALDAFAAVMAKHGMAIGLAAVEPEGKMRSVIVANSPLAILALALCFNEAMQERCVEGDADVLGKHFGSMAVTYQEYLSAQGMAERRPADADLN